MKRVGVIAALSLVGAGGALSGASLAADSGIGDLVGLNKTSIRSSGGAYPYPYPYPYPQALPTARSECGNGGWADFGFESRRQCVRFVRLIPGPPPYPSTREQCRDGGWAQFGFESKRKCLRFVRLRPQP